MSFIVFTLGCGVKTFQGAGFKNKLTLSLIRGLGPLWASGQNGDVGTGMVNGVGASACTTYPIVGHPCLRARASVGVPFQFDMNPNDDRRMSQNAAPSALAGTMTSAGTIVTGVGSAFIADFGYGDMIQVGGQVRVVMSVLSNTSLLVNSTFTPDIGAATAYDRILISYPAGVYAGMDGAADGGVAGMVSTTAGLQRYKIANQDLMLLASQPDNAILECIMGTGVNCP